MNNNLVNGWEVVIGLEIHAQVASNSKLFSSSATSGEDGPNSRVNFFDAGMPGVLPVINSKCIDLAIKTGLGIYGKINEISVFDRKNYFYPDLPSGYQISQFFYPIVTGGYVEIGESAENEQEIVRIGITRIHLEQDAGKNIHDLAPDKSFVDLNRSGIALMEIVTEPDMRSVFQAVFVAKKLHALVQYLETCNGNMEQGNFRVDANISMHKPQTPFGTRAEIKNLNSFKFMQAALTYEIERQMEILEGGGKIVQETRLFDVNSGVTMTMREKEDADDYRYFPDPDLPALILTKERIQSIADNMPELPDDKKRRFIKDFGLSEYDATILTSDRKISLFYDEAIAFGGFSDALKAYKLVANWIIGDLFAVMKENDLSIRFLSKPISSSKVEVAYEAQNQSVDIHEGDWGESQISQKPHEDSSIEATNKFAEEIELRKKSISITPLAIAKLIALIQDGTISGKIAKTVFEKMWKEGIAEPIEIVESLGLKQISSEAEILPEIRKIIAENPGIVAEYKNGRTSVFGFFVGQVMKKFKGQASPDVVNKLLYQELDL
ncbi:MAG: Asp-tRNA(Asn)/Glu-tRNA(Gln) amidotransferase subunit GatB [Holosporales bacterium]|jgi:aspartyl-tRNA(Asn)/glutamyl-tRNA(Gln) amidotransferase subunit B|nr:Asp-tRNA(Asn)/Glu-tRNA(Gln) amidotransferase subunit GatB [Holosporales bacterium]